MRLRIRRPSGSLAALLMIGIIPMAIGIGALAVDMMKVNAVHSELQKACDAGALAGSLQLYQFTTPPSAGFDNIVTAARVATSLNTADGRPVSNLSENTVVTITVYGPVWPPPPGGGGGSGSGSTPPPGGPGGHGHWGHGGPGMFGCLPQTTNGTLAAESADAFSYLFDTPAYACAGGHGSMGGWGTYGTGVGLPPAPGGGTTKGFGGAVLVQASLGVDTLFSKIFGRPIVTLNCAGYAGATGDCTVASAGELFPMAVSLNANGPDGWSLSQITQDQYIDFAFANNADGNCAWIGSAAQNANWMNKLHTANGMPAMGVSGSTPAAPGGVTTTINVNNGAQAANEGMLYSQFAGKVINCPVIVSTPCWTDPYRVVGFVSIQVAPQASWPSPPGGAETVWRGMVVASEIAGVGGSLGTSGNAGYDSWINNNSAEPVKLLQ